jgi:phytanoyl-CoA hydroxylase
MSYLSNSQINDFHRNGYLVIDDFWIDSTVQKLRTKIGKIVSEADLSNITSVFSTTDDLRQADKYFLNSGREIRFFWEEKAWKDGQLIDSPEFCINKVGHGLHDLDPDFEEVSYEARVGSICSDLGLVRPVVAHSMYIFKQPRFGGESVPHQDGAFLYTVPQSCIGFWWPLDNCTLENGCLRVVPGSHNIPVTRRFRRSDPPSEGTEFTPLEPVQFDVSDAVPLIINKGALVVLHNAVVHLSKENLSEQSRHAYSIHVIEGSEGVVYPADNWLQRPEGYPFREITKRV